MMPVLGTTVRVVESLSPELRRTTGIVIRAARTLAAEGSETHLIKRYLHMADRLSRVLEFPRAIRDRLLEASPAVTELSGRSRTLIEMIEDDPGDDCDRLRIAKLLLRALIWRPESFCEPHC